MASLNALSDGRFILAVATGYLRGEYKALGVDFEERNALFDQAIEVMRGIWTQDDYRSRARASSPAARPRTRNPTPATDLDRGEQQAARVAASPGTATVGAPSPRRRSSPPPPRRPCSRRCRISR